MPLEPGRPWLAQFEERALYDDQAYEWLMKEIYPLLGYSSRSLLITDTPSVPPVVETRPAADETVTGGKPAEEPKTETVPKYPPAIQKLIEEGEKAEEELKKILGGRLFVGFDPTLIPLIAKFLAGKIAKGGRITR
jgi:hypothetical protein